MPNKNNTKGMSDQELRERIDMMATKVDEIHAGVFGVAGRGGLHKWVEDIDKDVDKLKNWKSHTLGIAGAIAAIVTTVIHFGGDLVANFLSGKK